MKDGLSITNIMAPEVAIATNETSNAIATILRNIGYPRVANLLNAKLSRMLRREELALLGCITGKVVFLGAFD